MIIFFAKIDFLKRTADAIEKVNELENENFKILHAINLEDSLKGVLSKQDKEYSHCPSVNLRTLITPKGVYACPYWRGKDDYKLGDITEQSFQSVWSSLKKKNMIDNLDPSKLCNFHCLRHTTNERCIDIKDSKNNLIISDKNTPDRFI